MAPASKKAKTAPKPAPGSGLGRFFGAGASAKADAPVATAGAPSPELPCSTTGSPAAVQSSAKAEAPATTATPVLPLASQPSVPSGESVPAGSGVSGGLTEAQKQRIEENRRKALERKQGKKDPKEVVLNDKATLPSAATGNGRNAVPDTGGQKSPSPLKPLDSKALKRKGSDITPEKIPLPEEMSRVSPTATSAPAADSKFHTFGKQPWMQYNNLYTLRLQRLRGQVLAQAKSLWSGEVPADNFLSTITSTSTGSSSDVVFTGVTFKDMPSRSNVIEQYRDCLVATSCLPEDDVDTQPNLCSEADVVWLEDAAFRIQLKLPAEEVAKLATGFVASVRGQVTQDGQFDAKSICLAHGLVSTPLPAAQPSSQESDAPGPFLALVSGLFIGAPDEDIQARNRAVEFLLGQSTTENGLALGQAVQHVIVCGGLYGAEKKLEVPAGLEDADKMLSQLAQKLPVALMPGHKDPSNLSLPQMPLHPYLFRSAHKCSQFKSVSNPYQSSLGDLQVLGHSGQPVRDLMRCTSISTPMQALTTCLDACLLAPTAPDTLTTQSFDKIDPFVIDEMPQIFFSGGHEKLAYEWRAPSVGGSGTLCVCVPAFQKQPCVVLVNMRDPRDIRTQEFGTKEA